MEYNDQYEKWYDENRDELMRQYFDENPDTIHTDEQQQDIENNQQYQDWVDDMFNEYLQELSD